MGSGSLQDAKRPLFAPTSGNFDGNPSIWGNTAFPYDLVINNGGDNRKYHFDFSTTGEMSKVTYPAWGIPFVDLRDLYVHFGHNTIHPRGAVAQELFDGGYRTVPYVRAR